MHRAKTGEGRLVTGALLATALALNNGAIIEQAVAKPNRVATVNRSQISGPSDIFRTRDGFVLQVLDHPQVVALGLLQDTDYPGLPSPAPIAAIPLWMSATMPVARTRPPTIGEHTDEVLAEIGYDVAQIADFRARSVV